MPRCKGQKGERGDYGPIGPQVCCLIDTITLALCMKLIETVIFQGYQGVRGPPGYCDAAVCH